ncbi:MAG: hypothetical protein K2K57_01915, partial [Oscillospiraceae bacterium]|nr:hypothetical protein [Oscillospiraceae bacterium]
PLCTVTYSRLSNQAFTKQSHILLNRQVTIACQIKLLNNTKADPSAFEGRKAQQSLSAALWQLALYPHMQF